MVRRKKARTYIGIYKIREDGTKKHYKSIAISPKAEDVWKAINGGIMSHFAIDLEELRSQRLRKGGKR